MPVAAKLYDFADLLEQAAWQRVDKARPRRGRIERRAAIAHEPLIDAMEEDIVERVRTTNRELGSITTDFVYSYRDQFIAVGQSVAEEAATYGANVAINRAQRKGQSIGHQRMPERVYEEIMDDAADEIQVVLVNMRRYVTGAIRSGDTREEAIANVRTMMDRFRRQFVQRLARARAGAMEKAAQWVFDNLTTFEFQQWLTVEDERVRDHHEDMHGEVVAIGHNFSNGLEYPGQKRGPIEEWINCRCFLEPWEMQEGVKLPSDPTQPFYPDRPGWGERLADVTEEFRQWRADR